MNSERSNGLAGSVNVVLINPFALDAGQQFIIAEVAGNLSGTFTGLAEGAVVGTFASTDLMITYTGGDDNDVVLFTDDPVLLGDVNLDGTVSLLDIDPFIERLSTGTFQSEADCNQDGAINLLDIEQFIVILPVAAKRQLSSQEEVAVVIDGVFFRDLDFDLPRETEPKFDS